MKKYLLFAGERYYPAPGWKGLVGQFDSVEEAEAEGQAKDFNTYADEDWPRYDWWQIVSTETGDIVRSHYGG